MRVGVELEDRASKKESECEKEKERGVFIMEKELYYDLLDVTNEEEFDFVMESIAYYETEMSEEFQCLPID